MIGLALGALLGLFLGRSALGALAEKLVRAAFGAVAQRIAPAPAVQGLLGIPAAGPLLGLSTRAWGVLLPVAALLAALIFFGLWASGKGAARVEKRVAKETAKSEEKAVAIDAAVKTQQAETREKIVYRDRVIEKTVEVAKFEVRNAEDDEARFAAVRRALDGMCNGQCQAPAGNRQADSVGSDDALSLRRPLAG